MAHKNIIIRRLEAGEEKILARVADDVFDNPVNETWSAAFLAGTHNLLVVALAGDLVVGMGSGLFHGHPDKAPELWINEIGVSPAYQRQGIATEILTKMQQIAAEEGCRGCWLITEPENFAANQLYASLPGWDGPEKSVIYSMAFADD